MSRTLFITYLISTCFSLTLFLTPSSRYTNLIPFLCPNIIDKLSFFDRQSTFQPLAPSQAWPMLPWYNCYILLTKLMQESRGVNLNNFASFSVTNTNLYFTIKLRSKVTWWEVKCYFLANLRQKLLLVRWTDFLQSRSTPRSAPETKG